jgi:hypothetical protein
VSQALSIKIVPAGNWPADLLTHAPVAGEVNHVEFELLEDDVLELDEEELELELELDEDELELDE